MMIYVKNFFFLSNRSSGIRETNEKKKQCRFSARIIWSQKGYGVTILGGLLPLLFFFFLWKTLLVCLFVYFLGRHCVSVCFIFSILNAGYTRNLSTAKQTLHLSIQNIVVDNWIVHLKNDDTKKKKKKYVHPQCFLHFNALIFF